MGAMPEFRTQVATGFRGTIARSFQLRFVLGIVLSAFALAIACPAASQPTQQPGNKPVVGYLRANLDWSIMNNASIRDFVFDKVTHVVYIRVLNPNANGTLTVQNESRIPNAVAVTHSKGRKISVCVENWTEQMSTVCASPTARAQMVASLLQFCKKHDFDGVDFDWEYPATSDLPNFTLLLKELRAAAPPEFLVSAAIGYWSGVVPVNAHAYVDWFFIMGYSPKAPQWTYDMAVTRMNGVVSLGVPKSKLVLGLPIYGVSSDSRSSSYANIIGGATLDPSVDTYNGWSFNGPTTIRKKTKFVYDNGFAGIGWWDLPLDAFDNRSLLLAAADQARTSAFASATFWTGNLNAYWSDGANWTGYSSPTSSVTAHFGLCSSNNLATTLNYAKSVAGVVLYDPPADVLVDGQTLTIGSRGIDMQWSKRNLTFGNAVALAASQTWGVAASRTLTANAAVSGGFALTKNGDGTLSFTAANTYTGGTTINNGTLRLDGGSVAGNITNRSLLVWNLAGAQTFGGVVSGTGRVTKEGAGMLTLTAANSYSGGTTINAGIVATSGSGNLGSGGIVLAPSATLLVAGSGNLVLAGANTLNGTIQVDSKLLVFNNSASTGTPDLVLNGSTPASDGIVLADSYNGKTLEIGNFSGTANSKVRVDWGTDGTRNLKVNQSVDGTFDGVMADSYARYLAFTKAGAATLTLSGANTCTGATTVSAGALLVNGSLAASDTTVAPGATLGGTGTLAGATTVNGTLAPGANGIGTLTIDNAVTLGATATTAMELTKSGTTLVCDRVAGTGAVAFGGTLALTASGDALALGDSFTLFARDSYSGAFASLHLPSLGEGLDWDTSALATTGVVSVTTASQPTATTTAASAISSSGATLNASVNAKGANTIVTFEYGPDTSYGYSVAATPATVTGSNATGVSAALTGLGAEASYHFRVKAVNAVGTTYGGDLVFTTAPLTGNGTWASTTGGSWTEAANWKNLVIGSNAGNTADFSTLDLTADATVSLDGDRTIGHLAFGDTTPSNNWTLSTGTGGSLTLAVSTGTPSIAVDNRTATIHPALLGSNGLAKSGAGTLVLAGNNTYLGNTTIDGGVLELSASGKLYNGGWNNSNVITVNAGGTWRMPDYSYGGVGQLADYAARRVLNGGTIEVTGTTQNSGQDFTVTATGGTFRYAPAVTTDTLTLSGNANTNIPVSGALTFDTLGNITVSEIIEGTGSLVKTGAGTLTLSGVNTYSGGTTIEAGIVATNGSGNLGSGGIVLGPSATLVVAGSGNLVLTGANNLNGTIRVDSKLLVFNNSASTGTPDLVLNGSTLASDGIVLGDSYNGKTLEIGNFSGTANSKVRADWGTAGTRTLKVNQSADGTFAGVMENAPSGAVRPIAFTKAGPATLTLSGANSYTGATTVSAGTLKVNGSLGNTATMVGADAALGGTGTIGGATTVNGTVQPGDAAAGILTVNNTVDLSATGSVTADIVANSATTAGTDFDRLVTSTLGITSGATVNLVFDAPGSTVDFGDTFWSTTQRFKVVSTTNAVATAPALGTRTVDSLGKSSIDYGSFSVEVATDTLGIEVVWTPSSLANWRRTWFGTADNTGSAADTADPDGDGLANLIEYASGTDPRSGNPNPVIADLETTDGRTYLRLSIARAPDTTGVVIEGLSSNDLQDWSTDATVIEIDTPSFFRVRDALPIGSHPRRFLKLRVRQP